MATIGYARVSNETQDPTTQINALTAHGCTRVFADHGASSRIADRTEWIACRDYLRAGDVLVVYRLDRLAGSTGMMLQTLQDLDDAGVDVRSLTEPQIDTTTPMGRALFGMVAVFAQLRVDTIRQNTRDGLARARAEGRVGGRPTVRTPERVSAAQKLHAEGVSLRRIADALDVSASTVRRMLFDTSSDAF